MLSRRGYLSKLSAKSILHKAENSLIPTIYSQSWARDNTAATICNMIMFQAKQVLFRASCLFSWCLLHLDREALTFFIFFLVTEALISCSVVVVAKLKTFIFTLSNSQMS